VQRRKPLRAGSELPGEVRERLDALFSREAIEDALEGVDPDRITGPGGLITELAGRVIEAALAAELTGHLGHPPGGRPAGSNVRNGATPKTLQTDLGPVEIRTPRDRDGSFEPQLVGKGQTRLAGLDDRILDLYAGGLSTRDISAHLAELYGVEVGRDTISRVTSAVMEDSRPGRRARWSACTRSSTSTRCA
jgi:putative transposase